MKENLSDEELVQALERLDRFATLTDTRFNIPLTKIRFGIDSIIGLVPIVGDFVGLILSLYLLIEAKKLGLPLSLKLKMMRNVAIDFVLGLIPIIGDVGDVAYRANLRNVKLIVDQIEAEQQLRQTQQKKESPVLFWAILIALVVVLGIGSIYLLKSYV